MKTLLIFLLTTNFCFGSTLYFKDGNSVDAKILEANETHVKISRDKDLQHFRLKIDLLTIDSQKQIELYHSENRYSSIPSAKLPLDKNTLKSYANYVDELVDTNLRSKKIQKTKEIDDYTYARRLYLTTIGRIPTQKELLEFIDDRDANKKDK